MCGSGKDNYKFPWDSLIRFRSSTFSQADIFLRTKIRLLHLGFIFALPYQGTGLVRLDLGKGNNLICLLLYRKRSRK